MVDKRNENVEYIRERKQLCLIGLIIIFLSLFFGYFTAFHIYAEEPIENGDGKDITETETKENTENEKDMIEKLTELDKKINELETVINEKIDSLEDDNELILNYFELDNSIKEVKKEVEETLNPPEETKSPSEEKIILDTETQYQYYPYIMVIIALLTIMIFRRKAV